ncbi:MAG: lipopolysaccharide heptosyltransferase II [Acidobacteriota bacterium]
MNTLTISPNWVGDTVLSIPVFDSLAASGRTVTVLARPNLKPLLELVPSVSSILVQGEHQETLQHIRQREFEEAVVLPNSFRSALLPHRAGIDARWGYRSRSIESLMRGLLLRPAIPRPDDRKHHQVEDYVALLEAMGVEPPNTWTPRIDLSPAAVADGAALLDRAGLHLDLGPIVGLFPGAEFGPSKRWPWRRFVELSRTLRQSRPSSRQTILAGPKELWLAVRIHEETGKVHPVIGPDLDLGRLAHAISKLDLLITNDSGPMHLAAALDVPCLALFGPTNPSRTRPVGHQHVVMYTNRWCSPCFRRRCPLIHHRCMRELTADRVGEQALEMLDSRK